MKNKHRTLNGGQKKTLLGGPKEKEARKVFRKAMKASRNVVFALTNQKRVHERISTRTKAEARKKKERVRKVLILNLDIQPRKHKVKKDMVMPGNRTIGLPAIFLTIPQPQLLGGLARELILHGWPVNLTDHPTHVVLDLACTRSIGSRASNRKI